MLHVVLPRLSWHVVTSAAQHTNSKLRLVELPVPRGNHAVLSPIVCRQPSRVRLQRFRLPLRLPSTNSPQSASEYRVPVPQSLSHAIVALVYKWLIRIPLRTHGACILSVLSRTQAALGRDVYHFAPLHVNAYAYVHVPAYMFVRILYCPFAQVVARD